MNKLCMRDILEVPCILTDFKTLLTAEGCSDEIEDKRRWEKLRTDPDKVIANIHAYFPDLVTAVEDEYKSSVLHFAVNNLHVSSVAKLLDIVPRDLLNKADVDGWTPHT